MKRGSATLIACAAISLAAGCGSSGYTSSSSSTKTAATTPPGGLKASTTPKFASPGSSAPVQSGVVPIAYRNITIAPDTLKVKVGSTIKWTNHDAIEHNVTSEGGPQKFVSKNLGEGKSFEIKLLKPGLIHYECTIHPASMNGTIEVVS
jgi:plastocyanin